MGCTALRCRGGGVEMDGDAGGIDGSPLEPAKSAADRRRCGRGVGDGGIDTRNGEHDGLRDRGGERAGVVGSPRGLVEGDTDTVEIDCEGL